MASMELLVLAATLLLTSIVLPSITAANDYHHHHYFNLEECGKTKNCLRSPTGCDSTTSCEYLFSYAPNANGASPLLTMELFTAKKKDRALRPVEYVAVGFSHDASMGDDAVIACTINADGGVELHQSVNIGKSNEAWLSSSSSSSSIGSIHKATYFLEDSRVDDSSLYCKFTTMHSNAGSTDWRRPDLRARSYYILLARGPVFKGGGNDGKLEPHSFDEGPDFPFVSATPLLLFTRPNEEGGLSHSESTFKSPKPMADLTGSNSLGLTESAKFTLMKFHGLLMISAWFGLVAMAIYTARYMRPAFSSTNQPKLQVLCGTKLWFGIHRGLNILAIVLIAVACVCALLAKDFRWTGPWFTRTLGDNLRWGRLHSLIGAAAVLLAMAQPVNALLRCAPEHPLRYRFNRLHRRVGLLSLGLAALTVLTAVWKFQRYWASPALAMLLFVLFAASALLLVALSEINWGRGRWRRRRSPIPSPPPNNAPLDEAFSSPETPFFRGRSIGEQNDDDAANDDDDDNINSSGRGKASHRQYEGQPGRNRRDPHPFWTTLDTRVLFVLALAACSITTLLYTVLLFCG